MAKLTAQEMQDKWSRRLKAATPDIAAGIDRVTVAPGIKAAQQSGAMLQGIQDSVSSGHWARRVSSVTVDEWKAKAKGKGVGRIAAGVDASAQKTTDVFGKVLAAVDGATAVVEQTPRGDLETNIGRATTFMREMAKRAPTKQGR